MPSYNSTMAVGEFKNKVVFVLGSTATGKSKLAINLAIHFSAVEIVNSDKMQIYDGLDIVTNKVTSEETAGIPHHLLGGVHPNSDFTASDFRREAMQIIESVIARGKIPIVAGGSNSYIEELVNGNESEFRSKYECCFLWVDVELPVLYSYIAYRVDKMVEKGLVEEVKEFFDPDGGDYSKGIRRAIGVPEMDKYFRSDEAIESAIEKIKMNTCTLACCQREKIRRLCELPGWDVRRIDATEVFKKKGKEAEEVWADRVMAPGVDIVNKFLATKTATRGMTVPMEKF